MSSIGVGNAVQSQRLRRAAGFAAVAAVFVFGILGTVASVSAPSTKSSNKFAEVHYLRTQQQSAMAKVNSAKSQAEHDQAVKELQAVETQLAKAEQEFQAAQEEDHGKASAPAQETASCFPAEMKVLTAEGARSIRDIRVGDRVLTADERGEKSFQPVLKTLADRNNHYYLINNAIKVTALHRIATAEGWKKAQDLKVGDRIRVEDGGLVAVESIERVGKDLPVYNLTVAENHNFYVTPDGQGGYLVHNCGGGGK
jgi:hypothetical protein